MGKFRQISTELLPLIYVEIGFGALFEHYSINFRQTLHVSRYYEGVLLDCISFNFVKKNTALNSKT